MKFYNTLSKKIEEFVPNEPGIIKMYTCGPTVYHYAHLGNIRTYILEDLFEKSFKYLGYKVERVMNITDVGHLQSDADTGEDKMAIAMEREHKTSHEIAAFYTKCFFDDCELVNVRKPDVVINATNEIEMYIKIISKLLDDGTAYIANGNIYYDTSKFSKYYELSGRREEDLIVASRSDITDDEFKKNPADFVLWFTNSKFGNQELQWDSPWEKGFPGWHIECSGISLKYLGDKLDIHCGAEDAVFPHHTNEIAQSEAYLGHKWCNYWIHLSWLLTGNTKMSKSKGDITRVTDLKNNGYNPLSFRYFIINSYYHKQLNFTFEALDSAEVAYKKLKNKISNIVIDGNLDETKFTEYDNKFKSELENDLNTSNAITLLYNLLKDDNVNGKTKIELIKSWDEVFSLDLLKKDEVKSIDEDYVFTKIEERKNAKQNKDYDLADKIRQELISMGIELIDTREGTTYKVVE